MEVKTASGGVTAAELTAAGTFYVKTHKRQRRAFAVAVRRERNVGDGQRLAAAR